MERWRLKAVLNAVNGSTALGLALAVAGGARAEPGPRGLMIASDYRLPFPVAGAFTVGNVVLTRHDRGWWEGRERVLLHEERHSRQYVVMLGLPMLPVYAVAAGWSYLRGGDWSTYNTFERRAGLADGGYPILSRRQRRRQTRTA